MFFKKWMLNVERFIYAAFLKVLIWLCCWVDFATAFIGILTLGLYIPNWDMGFRVATTPIIMYWGDRLNEKQKEYSGTKGE